MPIVHKQILGGEVWLPFARQKLWVLGILFEGKHAAQHFIMPDGARVDVRVCGEHYYLHITGGSTPGYEFFTTEHRQQFPPIPSGYPSQFVVGSGTRVAGIKGSAELKPKPVFSNVLTPQEGDKGWWQPSDPWLNFYKEEMPLGGESIVDNSKFFKTWASWQQEKGTEYTWWPNNGSDSLVTSTQSISGSMLNQCGWFGLPGPPPSFGAYSDVGFDVPPAMYDKKGARVGAPQLEEGVWWRRAAVQKVKSERYGTKEFFILTDTSGRFHIYPAKAYQKSEPGAVDYLFLPPERFKTFTPDYPSWVTLVPPGEKVGWSEFVWTFNKDATKAITIPMHSVPQKVWVPRPDDNDEYDLKPLYLKRLYPRVVGYELGDHPDAVEMRDDTSGLFEVHIKIELTGEGGMDFDVELTNGVTTFYGTDAIRGDGRHYLDAGYLLANRSLGENAESVLGAPEDALLTAEIEIWGKPKRLARENPGEEHEYEPGTEDVYMGRFHSADITAYYVVREHATQKEIRRTKLTETCGWMGYSFRPYKFNAKIVSIQQADLRSLSFLYSRYSWVFRDEPGPYTNAVSVTELHTANALAAGPVGVDQEYRKQTDFSVYPSATCEPPTPNPDFVKLPSDERDEDAAKLLMQGAAIEFCAGAWRNGIHVHPDGHWSAGGSLYDDIDGELDIIQAYNGTTALPRTSHKAAFNQAFGQDRDYSFYGAGQETDSDIGGFQSFGIWVTF